MIYTTVIIAPGFILQPVYHDRILSLVVGQMISMCMLYVIIQRALMRLYKKMERDCIIYQRSLTKY